MLRINRIEIEGFGPFADRQVIQLPGSDGVTVVYGENMRGKTTLLNAIRYAFFGQVVGRGSRPRNLHTISNRENAVAGKYGFSVSLVFEHDGDEYELVRECAPLVRKPTQDLDYRQEVALRKGSKVLGPQERDKALQQILPSEVSRFFLFDGELLQEYEELLYTESDAGHRISEAVERILGVPILKRGRAHLTQLSEDADKVAAREASKHQETEGIGSALQQATEQRAAHQREVARLQKELQKLSAKKIAIENELQSTKKYAHILEERDEATAVLDQAVRDEQQSRGDLQRAMSDAWRSILHETIRSARNETQREAQAEINAMLLSLRRKAVETGHCDTCEQDVPKPVAIKLESTLPKRGVPEASTLGVSRSLGRLADLSKFADSDNRGEVKQLCRRLRTAEMLQTAQKDKIADLTAALADSDPDVVRRTKASYAETVESLAVIKRGIDEEGRRMVDLDQNIQRLKRKLEATGVIDQRSAQSRAKALRAASEVFSAAIDEYKTKLRKRVEAHATKLFLSMTTETRDYAGLSINDGYGLTILHRDGRAEDARSAGAEHVVALALMGALQHNAPLRGPIVMDSPFGRLDQGHTDNVVKALPEMAAQVVLLVYQAEVASADIRRVLGSMLVREYKLERVSARRTKITEVK